jgi:hypothetical protein
VADELEGARVGLLLADARGQIVDRRAADSGILARLDRIELAPGFPYTEDLIGTNAIGTAIAQQAPSVVTGTEHFADALTSMACAAIPVTDAAGEIVGWEDLKWELSRVADGLMDALREAREMSRGIYPAILSERGLEPAVKSLARRSPVPVDLTVWVVVRLAGQVELGAYCIVSEALANVAKHANAETVMVSVEAGRDVLSLSARDDGVGSDDPDGSGLTGLRERVEALGGTLKLTSPPGRGTSVEVKLPAVAR